MTYQVFLEEAIIKGIALHRVGNKAQDEGYKASSGLLNIDEETKDILTGYLMSSFKCEKVYQFNHEHDLSMNGAYNTVKAIFENKRTLHHGSVDLLKDLYNKSTHVKIKGGEFYVATIGECIFEDELVQAIGIFKAEGKETFAKLKLENSSEFTIGFMEGNRTEKIDKGCVVLNTKADDGYRILNIDLKSSEAKFWQDEFLQITELKDETYHTELYMRICNAFATSFFKEKHKLDKVHFLSCCKDYFEDRKEFDLKEFKQVVVAEIEAPEALEEFENTIELHKESDAIQEEFDESFFISKPAFKSTKSKLKTKLKLDSSMDITLKSSLCKSEGYIERGFDEEKEMPFYKIYFNAEKA